uniref:ATP-dependent DNA helicase DDM1 n=1 Tax=Chenopodium quinoa TaxID=63459 RepID=A0A803KVV3_CHEQI
MAEENEMKVDDPNVDSPTSVLEDEDIVKEEPEVSDVLIEAKNGDAILISKEMAEEEEKLLEVRVKEEIAEKERLAAEAATLNESQFSKLDDLLSQTQLYSEFLLEKMDDITLNGVEEQEEEELNKGKKRGRGGKKKAVQYNDKKAKRAVAAMITRSKEGTAAEDTDLTEEERIEKEQSDLIPLLTGGKLKSYQIKGVKWLISLWQNGLNGILADQMGLGKTIQTIGFLAHLKGKGLDGPYMVIAPLSTLFTPSVKAIIYHGDAKERNQIRVKHMPKSIGPNFPIVITSYEVALNDARKHLRHYKWKYVIVDEGHRLKNSNCKLFKELKRLPIENKLLLTGTPLQNNLAELWSLLNFILPDIFSSHEEFESWFDLSGKRSNEEVKEEVEEKRRVVAKLHAILRPFLLRRMKADVEQSLPGKKEIILYATMTEHQKNFQEHLINRTLENHLVTNVSLGPVPRGFKGKLNNLMIQLRKNCNHPDLLESAFDGSYFYPPVEQIVGQCGKFQLLDSEKGFKVCRIDGHVKLEDRRRQINDFNDIDSEYRIFLLSTRAGGLGINLTAADTCILYDSDWNPQMDLQAMDRCHRIGQTKPVHVYRLATALSVEGRMLKRAFSKLRLEHVVIGQGQFKAERTMNNILEEEDLLELLREEEDAEDKIVQTEISDEDLEKVLDRTDLLIASGDKGEAEVEKFVLPLKGPGWEVVIPTATGGVLSTLNS